MPLTFLRRISTPKALHLPFQGRTYTDSNQCNIARIALEHRLLIYAPKAHRGKAQDRAAFFAALPWVRRIH
jgi:hypothetical protein